MKYLLYLLVFYVLFIIISAIDFNNNDADYLILLGSGLNADNESFTMLRRVNRASLYLMNNPDCKVIVSGGITGKNTISEAGVMKRLLIERHIEEDRIIVEDKAKNTIENVINSLNIIDDNSKKIVVCSSDYHILRSKLIALKKGYKLNSIFSQSTLIELIIHLPIEMIMIIYDILMA